MAAVHQSPYNVGLAEVSSVCILNTPKEVCMFTPPNA